MKRIASLDIIRVVAISLIFLYHFNIAYNEDRITRFFGPVGVALFFLLSGYLLELQYRNQTNLKEYYKKRLKAIYPLLIMTFFVFYLFHSIRFNNFLYGGPVYKMIFSILGIDAYLNFFEIQSYFVTGEWFTAAIIILYLIFPLLNQLMKRYKLIPTIVLFILFYISGYFGFLPGFYPVVPNARICVVTFIFWLGMLLERLMATVKLNYTIASASLILMIIIQLQTKLLENDLIASLLYSVGLFIFLTTMLKDIHFNLNFRIFIAYLSKISFAVYLIHHVIIYYILDLFENPKNSSPLDYYFILGMTILVVVLMATILTYVSDKLVELVSSFIKKREKLKKSTA